MVQRPAVVIIPDYDGIGPYELWRANLLAQLGYAGLQFAINPSKTTLTYLGFLLKCAALFAAMTSCWCSAAFVADIYGVAQVQGPALTSAQSSALDEMYLMDPELLLNRVGAGVAQVHIPVHVAFSTCHSSLGCSLYWNRVLTCLDLILLYGGWCYALMPTPLACLVFLAQTSLISGRVLSRYART